MLRGKGRPWRLSGDSYITICRSPTHSTVRHCGKPVVSNRLSTAYHRRMKLKESNPYLKSATDLKAALRISVQTSSAIEGIHAPFAASTRTNAPTNTKADTAHRKRRGTSGA